jgi:hypothetical protein
MGKKSRTKKSRTVGARPEEIRSRRAVVTSPTIVWEAAVFGAGGYQSASRFLLQGLIEAESDVEINPFWGTEMRASDAI